MTVPNEVWILPRPRKDYYKGSTPLHFEQKLNKFLGHPAAVLHPFGGKAEIGLRIDINPEVNPDIVADAHNLPFKDNSFDLVFCDPPYNEKYAKNLYGCKISVKYKKYISEAVRVCKPNGFVASYHWAITPRPEGTSYFGRIFIGGRVWHRPRVCCIYRKDT